MVPVQSLWITLKFQRGKVFLSTKNKGFDEVKNFDLQKDNKFEDTDAAAFDIDNDGDLDLYVVSGGNEYKELDKNYMDRVYLNDGLGNFTRLKIFLPRTNGSSVSVSDFNNDGYDDLFVGSRSITGFYGLSPYSFFLVNNKDNTLSPVEQQRYGMVTDSKWVDINSDGKKDVVLVGDWMPITVLIQEDDFKFINKTLEYGLSGTNGLWNVVEVKDFNEDGKIDIIAGNAGTNFKWKPSIKKPVKLLTILYRKPFPQTLITIVESILLMSNVKISRIELFIIYPGLTVKLEKSWFPINKFAACCISLIFNSLVSWYL